MKPDTCVKCGETREAIKRHQMICGEVSYEGELVAEFGRHRFKPYSKKELAAMKADDDEYCRQMGEFADFVEKQDVTH